MPYLPQGYLPLYLPQGYLPDMALSGLLTCSLPDIRQPHISDSYLCRILKDDATILVAQRVSDGMGRYTETWVSRGKVRCLLLPQRQTAVNLGRQMQSIQEWIVLMPLASNLQRSERVQIADEVYSVEGIMRLRRDWVQATLRRIEP